MYICYKSNELYTYIAYVLLCLNYTPVKTVLWTFKKSPRREKLKSFFLAGQKLVPW